ncbi:hypothetical protein TSUD_17460 [Trifolium subterraneum]|uniref:Uncharacterized protein n=1 Tax=Trifolium subterraneum TaxID=3900 RepID=A0A2Z6LYY0_TRISU|nr:hypothetical protein TSUD_17460 [Trifolium subterraneum]
MKIAYEERTSQPAILTPEIQEMIQKMTQNEALMKQMLPREQTFEDQLEQERAQSQKLQKLLSQRQSNSRLTPVVDPEDDRPYQVYGEEEWDENEEEDEKENMVDIPGVDTEARELI